MVRLLVKKQAHKGVSLLKNTLEGHKGHRTLLPGGGLLVSFIFLLTHFWFSHFFFNESVFLYSQRMENHFLFLLEPITTYYWRACLPFVMYFWLTQSCHSCVLHGCCLPTYCLIITCLASFPLEQWECKVIWARNLPFCSFTGSSGTVGVLRKGISAESSSH